MVLLKREGVAGEEQSFGEGGVVRLLEHHCREAVGEVLLAQPLASVEEVAHLMLEHLEFWEEGVVGDQLEQQHDRAKARCGVVVVELILDLVVLADP